MEGSEGEGRYSVTIMCNEPSRCFAAERTPDGQKKWKKSKKTGALLRRADDCSQNFSKMPAMEVGDNFLAKKKFHG